MTGLSMTLEQRKASSEESPEEGECALEETNRLGIDLCLMVPVLG